MRLKTDDARGRGDTPLGDAAFWLEETLALTEQISECLPRLWPDELPAELDTAEAMLLAAGVWPEPEDQISSALLDYFVPAAAGKRSDCKPESVEAAGEHGGGRPQVSPGATHIVRRERDVTSVSGQGGQQQRRERASEVSSASAVPDVLNEYPAVELAQELATPHTAAALPKVWHEINSANDLVLAAEEVDSAPEFYGLTAELRTAANDTPEHMDMTPGAVWQETAEESRTAGAARVIWRKTSGRDSGIESSLPGMAESSKVFKETAAVDIDKLAEIVAERLRERLEIILQSRPFV